MFYIVPFCGFSVRVTLASFVKKISNVRPINLTAEDRFAPADSFDEKFLRREIAFKYEYTAGGYYRERNTYRRYISQFPGGLSDYRINI